METLNNLADFLWVITKISILSLILVAIILEVLGGFLRILFRPKKVEEDIEWNDEDEEK